MPREDIRDDALSSQRTARDANTEGYDPRDKTDWPGDVDPGTVKDALDVLAGSRTLGEYHITLFALGTEEPI